MVLRLDPDRPLIWRTPRSVQFGVEPPVAVLEGVDAARELMLGVLARGSSRGVLDAVAASAGAGSAAVDRLLGEVAGVLARQPDPARDETGDRASPLAGTVVAVDGGGAPAAVMGELLQRLGARVLPPSEAGGPLFPSPPVSTSMSTVAASAGAASEPAVAAVVIAHYAVPPRRAAEWLRADLPHLLVEFGDRSVRVGPVVHPGGGPCAQCLEMHRVDADPAWPALASQLFQRRAPSADALGVSTAATAAARVLGEFLSGGAGLRWAHEAVRIRRPEYGNGSPGRSSVAPPPLDQLRFSVHPDCGCRSLPENETADARCSGVIRPPPRRGPGDRGRG